MRRRARNRTRKIVPLLSRGSLRDSRPPEQSTGRHRLKLGIRLKPNRQNPYLASLSDRHQQIVGFVFAGEFLGILGEVFGPHRNGGGEDGVGVFLGHLSSSRSASPLILGNFSGVAEPASGWFPGRRPFPLFRRGRRRGSSGAGPSRDRPRCRFSAGVRTKRTLPSTQLA